MADVGVYAFSYKIAMLVQIVLIAPMKQTWNPYIFSNINNLDIVRKRIHLALQLYFIVGVGMVLGLSSFTADILKLFAKPEYIEGTKIIFIVGYSYLIYGACALIAIAYHIAEKTSELPKYFTIGAISNIVLNFLIIPQYGYIGAAWTTIFSFLIIFFMYIINVNKYFHLPLQWKTISLFNLIGFIFYYIAKSFELPIFTKVLLLFIYLSISVLFLKKSKLNIIFSKERLS